METYTMGYMRKFVLYPKESVRVFEVNGREDAERLPWKDAGFFGRAIDFKALAKEYDGLHLTEEGNCKLHMGGLTQSAKKSPASIGGEMNWLSFHT